MFAACDVVKNTVTVLGKVKSFAPPHISSATINGDTVKSFIQHDKKSFTYRIVFCGSFSRMQ